MRKSGIEYRSADLLTFDGSSAGDLQICRVVALTQVSQRDVLTLAAQADWPASPSLTRALDDAMAKQGIPPARTGNKPHPTINETARNTDNHRLNPTGDLPTDTPCWHAIPYQGIDGRVADFHVLIGTAEFLEDGGIPISASTHTLLAEHTSQGWASLLVGAVHANGRQSARHRSVIGILAIGSLKTNQPMVPSTRTNAIADRETDHAHPFRTDSTPVPEKIGKRRGWRHGLHWPSRATLRPLLWGAFVVCVSAMAGLWLSLVRVESNETAAITRFGHIVNLLQPGLHIRPWWPIEKTTRLQPDIVKIATIGSTTATPSTNDPHETASIEHLALAGDLWPIKDSPFVSQNSSESSPSKVVLPHLIAFQARIEYTIGDVRKFMLSVREPDECVAILGESVIRQIIASQTMMETLGPRRRKLALQSQARLQHKLNALNTGIKVETVHLNSLQPAAGTDDCDLSNLLDELAEDQSQKAETITAARMENERLIAEARIKSTELKTQAADERRHLLQKANAHAQQVRMNLTRYVTDPNQTRRRLLLELLANTPPDRRRKLLDPAIRDGVARLLQQAGSHQTTSAQNRKPATRPAGGETP